MRLLSLISILQSNFKLLTDVLLQNTELDQVMN